MFSFTKDGVPFTVPGNVWMRISYKQRQSGFVDNIHFATMYAGVSVKGSWRYEGKNSLGKNIAHVTST